MSECNHSSQVYLEEVIARRDERIAELEKQLLDAEQRAGAHFITQECLKRKEQELSELREVVKWIPVGEQWPDDYCDIKLKDGSIIKYVLPQSDKDFYWAAPHGAIFINEFSVTHWTPSLVGIKQEQEDA